MTTKTPYGNVRYLRNRYYPISVFYMISWCFIYKQTGDFPRHTLQTEYNDSIASYLFILSLIDRSIISHFQFAQRFYENTIYREEFQ